MAISRPCYCNRTDVQRSRDYKSGLIDNAKIDRALATTADKIEGQLRRQFYPRDTTYRFDWPNYQGTYPWQVYLEPWDLQILTDLESPQGTVIALNLAIPYPLNRKPGFPARRIQLDRSSNSSFGGGATPQASIWATGTWGFTVDSDPAGTLTAAVSSTTATTITVSDGSQAGPGDVLIINPGQNAAPFPQTANQHTFGATGALTGERVIIQDILPVATGLTQSGAGVTTISEADNQLSTTGAGTINVGETLVLDAERMLVVAITSGVATVLRPWDGTVLASHSAATVNALRQYTVLRGQLGTTAATYAGTEKVSKHRVPQLIHDLAVAQTVSQVMEETSGYSRAPGPTGGPGGAPPGGDLPSLWREARATFGRQVIQRVI